jgi:putative spermidine/putrescine transport system substrate-binding protein
MPRYRSLLALVATAALLAASALPDAAAARDLTVVSWGGAYQDAQREVYFKPFMKGGVKMHEESWDGGIGVLRAKVQGGAADWDVVQVEAEELVLGCQEGLFERIDYGKLGGKERFLPGAVHDCGVGAILWSTVLAYDADKLKDGPRTWADFWNVKKWPGKRALRKGPKFTLEFALMADGVAPKEVYKVLRTAAGVDRAFKKLDELKPHLLWWEAGAQAPQLLASGEVVMTSAYNGRISAASKKDRRNFRVVWSQSIYNIDYWVVLKGTPVREPAYKFIAFASDPTTQKNLPLHIAYGVTTKAAAKQIDPKVLPELPSAPDNLVNAIEIDPAFWVENIDRLAERFNKWAAR